MSVFVVGLNGCRLMPVSERKARLLLKGGKASVYRKVPFTIKLNYKTGSTVQPQCGQLKPRMLKIQRFWAYILDFFI